MQFVSDHIVSGNGGKKTEGEKAKHIADIIERGIREHPELSVGMQTEGNFFKNQFYEF